MKAGDDDDDDDDISASAIADTMMINSLLFLRKRS